MVDGNVARHNRSYCLSELSLLLRNTQYASGRIFLRMRVTEVMAANGMKVRSIG